MLYQQLDDNKQDICIRELSEISTGDMTLHDFGGVGQSHFPIS
jgi:hypothetical protein